MRVDNHKGCLYEGVGPIYFERLDKREMVQKCLK